MDKIMNQFDSDYSALSTDIRVIFEELKYFTVRMVFTLIQWNRGGQTGRQLSKAIPEMWHDQTPWIVNN